MWNRGVVFLEDGRGGSRGSRLLKQKCGSCISSMLSPGLMPWSHYTASRLVIGSLAHQRDWSAAEGVTRYKSNMRDVTQMWSELFVFWFAAEKKTTRKEKKASERTWRLRLFFHSKRLTACSCCGSAMTRLQTLKSLCVCVSMCSDGK